MPVRSRKRRAKGEPGDRQGEGEVHSGDRASIWRPKTASGETAACAYPDFPNHFGFFLPLAGITTVRQIRNNPIDIQATGRLNRLYVELQGESGLGHGGRLAT